MNQGTEEDSEKEHTRAQTHTSTRVTEVPTDSWLLEGYSLQSGTLAKTVCEHACMQQTWQRLLSLSNSTQFAHTRTVV